MARRVAGCVGASVEARIAVGMGKAVRVKVWVARRVAVAECATVALRAISFVAARVGVRFDAARGVSAAAHPANKNNAQVTTKILRAQFILS